MKRYLLSVILLFSSLVSGAQPKHPAEWLPFMGREYLSNLQSDFNTGNISETAFKEQLVQIARKNLAQQVQIQVQSHSADELTIVNGKSNERYRSISTFTTDVEMNLVETRTHYNPATREGFAIAYLHKASVRRHYENELQMALRTVENGIQTASVFIEMGFKDRAKGELERVNPEFDKTDGYFFWMSLFDMPQAELNELTSRRNTLYQTVQQQLAELQHGTTICINCVAQLFDTEYYELDKRVRGILSEMGCNFTNSPSQSDWVIAISAFAREGQATTFGTRTSYFANAEAKVVIYKMATKQNIYENIISKKGGDTRNFTEAARAAYKELTAELGEILTTTIKQ